MKIALLPLARSTFDVDFAETQFAAILDVLDATEHQFCGSRKLLLDLDAGRQCLTEIEQQAPDQLLIVQVTFTDAAMTLEAATRLEIPLAIWAIPEPRLGGRLRLNAFCGLNLASHALGRNHKTFSWHYGSPEHTDMTAIDKLFNDHQPKATITPQTPSTQVSQQARALVDALSDKKIGRIGDHPDGFDTCAYNPDTIKELSGVAVDVFGIDDLLNRARQVAPEEVTNARALTESNLSELDTLDQKQLDKSLRIKCALDQIQKQGKYDAFAIRCWPEVFTEYGGAVCGPASMLGEARIPCACEADVYGALSQMILQQVADDVVFLSDLVDMDVSDNTGVVWHCGQAPISMRSQQATATVHTNRKMPLLYQFKLKPGQVTFMRISQGQGKTTMVLAGGTMLDRPMAFTGTSGVVRFDRPVEETTEDLISCGLEHHMVLAYGEHRPLLREVATAMNLPVVEL